MTLKDFKELFPEQYGYLEHHAKKYHLLDECISTLESYLYKYRSTMFSEEAWEEVNAALYDWDI